MKIFKSKYTKIQFCKPLLWKSLRARKAYPGVVAATALKQKVFLQIIFLDTWRSGFAKCPIGTAGM